MEKKKLGFGLMRLPLVNQTDAADVDVEQVKIMVDRFLEKGFTYFDTAWMYCGFNSENVTKTALVDRHPRESYTLATKLHAGFIEKPEDRDRIFNEQRAKTGVSYFDYYLLHGLEAESYQKMEKLDCFSWIVEKKEQGLVKNIGFSYHDSAQLLDEILTKHPEMEFVQLQINYLDWDNEWIQSAQCYEVATKHGKPVIVMEPVKGGTLARLPEAVESSFRAYAPQMSMSSWAIRFAASLDNVMMVLSGMSSVEQLEDNISYMEEFKPLCEQERELIRKAVSVIKADITIPCTGCSYCTSGCPKQIAIPQYFSLYNGDMQEAKEKGWTPNGIYYEKLAADFGKASECIACGQCEGVCPQHLPIIEHLRSVAEHFEGKN